MTSMYNKLFTKILDSTIWLEPDPYRIVWITLIAAMDEDSNVYFACAENLAMRARVSLADAEAAIACFESPDKRNKGQEYDGRRIERIPGGWHILNGQKYRGLVTRAIMREQNRVRVQRFRDKNITSVTTAKRNVTVMQSDSVSDSVSDSSKSTTAGKRPRAKAEAPGWFGEFKASYPKRAGDPQWGRALRAACARIGEGHKPEEFVDGARRYSAYIHATGKQGTEYVKQASSFLGPDKPFLLSWDAPATRAEIKQNSTISAAQRWLEQSNAGK